jgi:hypothetical protein
MVMVSLPQKGAAIDEYKAMVERQLVGETGNLEKVQQ